MNKIKRPVVLGPSFWSVVFVLVHSFWMYVLWPYCVSSMPRPSEIQNALNTFTPCFLLSLLTSFLSLALSAPLMRPLIRARRIRIPKTKPNSAKQSWQLADVVFAAYLLTLILCLFYVFFLNTARLG